MAMSAEERRAIIERELSRTRSEKASRRLGNALRAALILLVMLVCSAAGAVVVARMRCVPSSLSVSQTRTSTSTPQPTLTARPTMTARPRAFTQQWFFDDFSAESSGWLTSDKAEYCTGYQSGEYRLLVKAREQYAWVWREVRWSDCAVEVDARQVDPDYGYYGIALCLTDFYHYCFVLDPVSCRYVVWRDLGDGQQVLVDWTWSEYILTLFSTNHLRVEKSAEQMTMVVNGHRLATISADYLPTSMRAAVVAGTWSATDADARFDDFAIWVPADATPVPSPTATPTPRPTSPPVYGRSADGLLELREWDYAWRKYGGVSIAGTVVSRSYQSYSYVEIWFNLYDKNGAQVGNAWTNVTNLDALGTWRFEALVLEDNVYHATFVALRGW